jgi:membrane-anchored protein YejM (alkaline phosphatase superfamily)
MTIQYIFFNSKSIFSRISILFLSITTSILIFIAIADIPYFNFFHTRVTEASLQWMSSWKMSLDLIFHNNLYLFYFILAILLPSIWCYFIYTYLKKEVNDNQQIEKKVNQHSFVIIILTSFFIFVGIRGRIDSPIRISDAIYCTNPILNQAGLNPTFTFIKSLTEKVMLMDEDNAIKYTQDVLLTGKPIESISPIAHQEIATDSKSQYNVVLVLMESMSANYLSYFGNENHLTPTLDSLIPKSLFFENAYSAGIHTNNGIFSSLYSYPSLKRIRPMSTIPMRDYTGIPYVLKQKKYKNLFFTTHYEIFDNISTFIPHNHFDELYSAEDYPKEKSIGPFGVPDEYLFNYAINKFNTIDTNQAFFATILTTSNHDPYILPADFKAKLNDKALNAVNYADWSIGMFLQKAKKTTWFKNTIFIFVADHGFRVGKNEYDLELSYQHIPILLYAPSIIQPQIRAEFTGQIDLFPLLMDLMDISYVNNTFGIDVLKKPRKAMYFSADDKIGCIDSQWLYVYHFGGNEFLYHYKNGDQFNYKDSCKTTFDELKQYALSQIQCSEWMYSHNLTGFKKQ